MSLWKLVLVIAAVCVVMCLLFPFIRRADERGLVREQDRIQNCKDMGGHPVLYWHSGYDAWLLDTCRM